MKPIELTDSEILHQHLGGELTSEECLQLVSKPCELCEQQQQHGPCDHGEHGAKKQPLSNCCHATIYTVGYDSKDATGTTCWYRCSKCQEDCDPAVDSAPVLRGEWRHSCGTIFCGTLRIAKGDFDTNPHPDFCSQVFDDICRTMNAAQNNQTESLPKLAELQARCEKAEAEYWPKALALLGLNGDKLFDRIRDDLARGEMKSARSHLNFVDAMLAGKERGIGQ